MINQFAILVISADKKSVRRRKLCQSVNFVVHHHLEAARTALMENMNILQILAIVLSAVHHLMDLVLTAHLVNTCMVAMERSVSSVDQLQLVPVHTVHTENTRDN